MKLLIDGNIVLDVLCKREPHFEDSSKIWKLCETRQAEGYISALTFANLVYVMRKQLSADMIEDVLNSLCLIFHFVDLTGTDLFEAAAMKWSDYEDALQATTATRLKADHIITRNTKDFLGGQIEAVTPSAFLSSL